VNILQLYPKSDYFTGAAIQLRDLALGLAGHGHHVVVATRPNEHWGRA
jgi:outer membrane protein assembly factor BamD (BamD/ComL family)